MKTFKFLTARAYAEQRREEYKMLKEPNNRTRIPRILLISVIRVQGFSLRSLRPLRFINVLGFLCVFVGFCVFVVSGFADYNDYTGVIHVHTIYSDGRGTIEEIAKIANRQKLDFIIITDHNTLKPLFDNKEGMYKNTLILIGEEISTSAGHYLALNLKKEVLQGLPVQKIIDEVNKQGGLGFIAHPYRAGKRAWSDWGVENFTGLEVYNIVENMLNDNLLSLTLKTILLPQRILLLSSFKRPDETFLKWDNLTSKKKAVGIIGNNAHGKRILFIRLDPYDVMFAFARTHIFAEQLSKESIYAALKQGHCYGSIDALGEPKGFNFVLKKEDKIIAIMGDEAEYANGLNIETSCPQKARVKIFKDGQIIKESDSLLSQIYVSEKGVYRVELFKKGKLWIFSNPIYIR